MIVTINARDTLRKRKMASYKIGVGERVFCNPPYGRELPKWIEKSYHEAQKPGTLVVMLIPARTDTRVFHEYIYGKAEIEFIRGRIKFEGAEYNAPFPSMLVIYGHNGSQQRANISR